MIETKEQLNWPVSCEKACPGISFAVSGIKGKENIYGQFKNSSSGKERREKVCRKTDHSILAAIPDASDPTGTYGYL